MASADLRLAVDLALETGLRQGDLVALTWTAFDGQRINCRTGKRGRHVSILLGEQMRDILIDIRNSQNAIRKGGDANRAPEGEMPISVPKGADKSGPRVIAGPSPLTTDEGIASTHILTNHGRPWTGGALRSAFKAAKKAAGVTDLHFNDLRGTAVTRAANEGATNRELASFFGWSRQEVDRLLEAHYLAEDQRAGDAIVARRKSNVVRLK